MMRSARRIAPLAGLVLIASLLLCGPGRDVALAMSSSDTTLQREIATEDSDLADQLSRPLELRDCVQIALKRNVRLAMAREAYDAVSTQVPAAYGAFLPVFTLGSVRVEERSFADSSLTSRLGATARVQGILPIGTLLELSYGYTRSRQDGTQGAEAGLSRPQPMAFTVTQPLLRDGGWRRGTSRIRDAHLSTDAAEVDLHDQELVVIFEVKSAYYDVIRRRRLIDVNKQAVVRDEELLAYSKAKVEASLATQRDVLSAEIVLEQDRSRLLDAESRYEAALDRVAETLGLSFGQPLQVSDVDMELQKVSIDEAAWVARALRENPRAQRARLDLQRLEIAKLNQGNARLPALDLTVRYDEQRDRAAASNLSGGLQQRAWQGGVTLTYPLFNKPLKSAYRKSLVDYSRGQRQVVETERQVTLLVRDTVRNLERIEDRIAILKREIEGARTKVEFAKVNFQLGRASNFDITDAQKDLVDAETNLVNEQVNYRVELARLEQLLGGSI